MTITELVKSTIDSSKDRLKTPIVGSYICSFIIFNWRPILILLFSDEKVEQRIKTVNLYFDTWYWTLISIIIPLLMVGVYTFLIPMLMVWVDEKLRPTKEARITGIYLNKKFTIEKKIGYAALEFQLKQSETGSKKMEDLQDEIKALQETNEQITTTNKNSIEQLNSKLREANDLIEFQNGVSKSQSQSDFRRKKEKEENEKFIPIINGLLDYHFKQSEIDQILLLKYSEDGTLDLANASSALINSWVKIHLLVQDELGDYQITEEGKIFIKYLKEKQDIEDNQVDNKLLDSKIFLTEVIDEKVHRSTAAGVLRETSVDASGFLTGVGSNERIRFLLINGMIDETPKGYILTEKGMNLWRQVQYR